MKKLIRIFVAILLINLLSSCEDKIQYSSDPVENIESLWKILDERYCYFDAKDIDWNGVLPIYREKASNVKNIFELFDTMAQMLDTLNDGHVNLISPFDVSRNRGWYEDYPANYNSTVVYGEKYLGVSYKTAGGLHYGRIENGTIGYIRYSSFSSSFSSSGLRYINAYFAGCKGIIIDVRNNGGGSVEYASSLGSCFMKEKTLVGYTKHKTGKGHNDYSEPYASYSDPSNAPIDWSDKRVAVLTNRMCYSATNDFVNIVKHAPNVKVIGGITGGGGGLPSSNELPNGWKIRYSSVPSYDVNMNHIEFGIAPDIKVDISTEDLPTKDTIIERAISWIVNNQ